MTTETPTADPLDGVTAAIAALGDSLNTRMEAALNTRDASMLSLINERLPATPATPEPNPALLPGGQRMNATDRVRDKYDQLWGDTRLGRDQNELNLRANFELAGMMFDAAGRFRETPIQVAMEDGKPTAQFKVGDSRCVLQNDQIRCTPVGK